MNVVETNSLIEFEPQTITRIKTRTEAGDGQNVVAISGSNSDGNR